MRINKVLMSLKQAIIVVIANEHISNALSYPVCLEDYSEHFDNVAKRLLF